MDVIKLRNDYLKKINKTASELNRRLSFLNEINNTISQNNMIGGSSKPASTGTSYSNAVKSQIAAQTGLKTAAQTGPQTAAQSTASGSIDVEQIIRNNSDTVKTIKDLIIDMKAEHQATSLKVVALESASAESAKTITLLNQQKNKLESQLNTLSTSQDGTTQEISKLREENQRYMDSIRRLSDFVNSNVSSIRNELTK
jgi:chromosome segregation ATPase